MSHKAMNGEANHNHMNGHHATTTPSAAPTINHNQYPENVGILAMEVYFPCQYVDQAKLEQFDQVSTGKYTIGLGQFRMSFCLDNEDINSVCMTALNNLLDKYSIKPSEIGRLEVGTETIIDKSKSVKSTLMSLFDGNNDVEGVDSVNACFGGTSAIFNAVNWIESSYWDGRYAAVVMGDLALYAKGNARPTGGAGAIAMLIGPNAPLVFERGLRSTYISHSYDFYKPVLDSEYPIVDGKLSISCYLNALDQCYNLYKSKFRKRYGNDFNNNTSKQQPNSQGFDLNSADAFLFHSPYCKLVQKSFARLFWNDYLEKEDQLTIEKEEDTLKQFKSLTDEENLLDKNLEKELVKLSEKLFKNKTARSLQFAKEIGNMYTPSLYSCLISYLLSKPIEELVDSRVCLFSYGSGLAASMFSLVINNTAPSTHRFSLANIVSVLSSRQATMLQGRVEIDPSVYDSYLQKREKTNKQVPRTPHAQMQPDQVLYPGTWYLKSVDDKYRRLYARVPLVSHFDTQIALQAINTELSS